MKAIGVDTETSTSETVNITVTVDATTDTDNPVFLFSDAQQSIPLVTTLMRVMFTSLMYQL